MKIFAVHWFLMVQTIDTAVHWSAVVPRRTKTLDPGVCDSISMNHPRPYGLRLVRTATALQLASSKVTMIHGLSTDS